MNTPMTLPETLENAVTTLPTGEKITLNEFFRRQYADGLFNSVPQDTSTAYDKKEWVFDSIDGSKTVHINRKTGAVVFDEPTKSLSPNNLWLIISRLESLPEAKEYLNQLFSEGKTLTRLGEADTAGESTELGVIQGRRELERELRESILILTRRNKLSDVKTVQAIENAFRVRTDHLESNYNARHPVFEPATTRTVRPEDLELKEDVFVEMESTTEESTPLTPAEFIDFLERCPDWRLEKLTRPDGSVSVWFARINPADRTKATWSVASPELRFILRSARDWKI